MRSAARHGAVSAGHEAFTPRWLHRTLLASATGLAATGGLALAELRRQRDLARTFAVRATALERANRDLVEAGRLKSELVDILGHDLNQPLFVITGHTDLLLKRWDRLPDEERRRSLQPIGVAARQLTDMLADLQLTFRLDSREIRAARTAVPVGAVLDQALADLEPDTGVEVAGEPDLAVLADRAHLRRMLGSLLTNAATYGGAPIRVEVTAHGPAAEVAVCDSGPGVPPDFVPRLFERFTRAEDSAGTYGSGLGLFIAHRLAEVNGGELRYRPGDPHGAVFVLRLGLAPLPVPAR
jgi:signal transduction histidine kinase